MHEISAKKLRGSGPPWKMGTSNNIFLTQEKSSASYMTHLCVSGVETFRLIQRNMILLEKAMVAQLVSKFIVFHAVV